MVVIAFVQVAVPFLLITYGENQISSSLAAILVASAPIFTALLALRFDHAERSQGWALVGIVIGIVGVALLFGVDLRAARTSSLGGAMVLLAALGYAIACAAGASARLAGARARGRRRRDDGRRRARTLRRCSSPRRRAGARRSTRVGVAARARRRRDRASRSSSSTR